MRRRGRISAEEFIRIWQASPSVAEVESLTGLPRETCITRASRYRRKGISMKAFRGPRRVADLQALARELGGTT